jgi:hypothetical protein
MKIQAIQTTVLGVPTPKPIALEYPEPDVCRANGFSETLRS